MRSQTGPTEGREVTRSGRFRAGTVLDDSAHLEDPTKVPSKLDWLGAINWAAQVIYVRRRLSLLWRSIAERLS